MRASEPRQHSLAGFFVSRLGRHAMSPKVLEKVRAALLAQPPQRPAPASK